MSTNISSATGASATANPASAVRLTDATQYATWSMWAIGLFQQARLLEDIKPTMPHYPYNGYFCAALVTELALLKLHNGQLGICPVNSSGCPTVNIAIDLIL
jgi:hypothetical protein